MSYLRTQGRCKGKHNYQVPVYPAAEAVCSSHSVEGEGEASVARGVLLYNDLCDQTNIASLPNII